MLVPQNIQFLAPGERKKTQNFAQVLITRPWNTFSVEVFENVPELSKDKLR